MNKVVSRETALERVKSGQTLMVGDFLATGTPEYLIDGVMERDISALTMISCTTGMPDKGCGKLIVGKRVKKVITSHIGTNPETGRQMIAATKLDADDEVVGVIMLSASDVLTGTKKVILLTKDGLSLGFPLSEVSELKKTSRGVKGITLEKEDTVAFATVVHPAAETFEYEGKTLNARRVRNRKRAAKGQKANLMQNTLTLE